MVSNRILEFIFRHPGVEVTFRQFFNKEDVISILVYDPLKELNYDYSLKMNSINHDAYIKYVLDIIEKAMYGDKEETQ